MKNSVYIKEVVVKYHNGEQLEIDDEYRINNIGGLLSLVTPEAEEELKLMINMENISNK